MIKNTGKWHITSRSRRSPRSLGQSKPRRCFAVLRRSGLPLSSALEVVPSQTLSTLHRAGSSFVLHRLVLSVFGTRCSLFFSGCVTPLLLFFQHVVIMRFCLTTFAMLQSFSSVLGATPVRSIGRKPFLTRRCSGLTHKAASTAELIR